jgi:hypothetical protein
MKIELSKIKYDCTLNLDGGFSIEHHCGDGSLLYISIDATGRGKPVIMHFHGTAKPRTEFEFWAVREYDDPNELCDDFNDFCDLFKE